MLAVIRIRPRSSVSTQRVPAGSQGRAKALAARITSLSTTVAPASWRPGDALILSADWIRANASSGFAVRSGALAVSDDGQHATRPIYACIGDSDTDRADVVYDLLLCDGETPKARDDKHRRREEACIRRLDAAAAEAYRAKRAREQRSRRADEAAVRDVLYNAIVQLEQQAQQDERAERHRVRAERAETQRLKKKRRYRRAALTGVHPCDLEMIEAVDDTLDFQQQAEEAEQALAGDAEIVWSDCDSEDESSCEQQDGGDQSAGGERLPAVERARRQLEMEQELRSMEEGGLNAWGHPIVPLDKFSDYIILKKEVHQLDTAGWVRGMPEDVKCKCSLCRLAFEDCQQILDIRTENLEMNPASDQGQQEAERCKNLLEVLYHFPPKKPKHVKPFDWQCMMW